MFILLFLEDYDEGRVNVAAPKKPVINLKLERMKNEMDSMTIQNANDSDAIVERSIPADSHRLVAMATTMGKCLYFCYRML